MDRKEFLSILGIGAAAIACGSCLEGCSTNDGVTDAPTNVDFTLNLNDAAYAVLKTNGGSLPYNGLVIARTLSGSYAAVSISCTHAGTSVEFDAANNRFHCPNHGSNFGLDGSVINGPAGRPLAKYNTTLTGSSLRVFS